MNMLPVSLHGYRTDLHLQDLWRYVYPEMIQGVVQARRYPPCTLGAPLVKAGLVGLLITRIWTPALKNHDTKLQVFFLGTP